MNKANRWTMTLKASNPRRGWWVGSADVCSSWPPCGCRVCPEFKPFFNSHKDYGNWRTLLTTKECRRRLFMPCLFGDFGKSYLNTVWSHVSDKHLMADLQVLYISELNSSKFVIYFKHKCARLNQFPLKTVRFICQLKLKAFISEIN